MTLAYSPVGMGLREPQVIVRRIVGRVPLIQPERVGADVAHLYARVVEDFLFERQVPLVGTRCRLFRIHVNRLTRPARNSCDAVQI